MNNIIIRKHDYLSIDYEYYKKLYYIILMNIHTLIKLKKMALPTVLYQSSGFKEK